MALVFRPALAEDLVAADSLAVGSINDLTVRHGFGVMAAVSPPSFQLYSLKDDPEGLWVADDSGEISGFAWSWACDDLWFLSQLFVHPARQGEGIGRELLKRTMDHARKSKAAHQALITFTFNRVSQGLYIRHGLFPKTPIYLFSVERNRVMARLPQSALHAVEIEDTPATMGRLGQIDRGAIGVSREKHHRYLITDQASRGVFLYAGGECVGYSYSSSNGHIGPLAVTRGDVLPAALATALKIAAEGSSEKVSVFLPGTCGSALSLAVNQGMRITFPMLLMATSGYDSWTQYLPRNPGYM